MQEKPIGAKRLELLPWRAVIDVTDYLVENGDPQRLDRSVADLGPREFFKMWLEWNGILGYADDVLELVEALG